MNRFASGPKRHYYGKRDVIVYRANRNLHTPAGANPVFGASVMMLLYGEAFWNTYVTGDNTGLIATDSIKNFIQRETMIFEGHDLEGYCRFLAEKFLNKYSQVEGLQVSADEIPFARPAGSVALLPSGPEQATARVELDRRAIVEVASGIRGFQLLRLTGSAFSGFVRDEYTTLPDLKNRPLNMGLDLEWTYSTPSAAFTGGILARRVRDIVRHVFESFESASIQQLIHEMGTRLLTEIPAMEAVHLEACNRTWDTIAEKSSNELGVYTDARPAFGCLGLTLTRG